MRKRVIPCFLTALFLVLIKAPMWAQENIPVGTWRLHLSFNELRSILVGPDQIWAANDVGVIKVEKKDQQISTISKIDGLSSAVISAIGYDQQRNMLLIGFENGLLNILKDNTISVYSNLANSAAISGSRKINHVTINSSLAYLSTDFGVVVFDLDKTEVKETYRDLSATGETLIIRESVIFQDSLFLATEKGVLAGAINGTTNLLDFRNWKRYEQADLNNPVSSITLFKNSIYAAIDSKGIFRFQNGTWMQQAFLQTAVFKKIAVGSSNLIVTTSDKVWSTDGVTITEVATGSLTKPSDAREENGTVWVADGKNGIVAVLGTSVQSTKPNGPSSNLNWRINYSGDRIIYSKGGFVNSIPLNRDYTVDQFINGQWSVLSSVLTKDITDQVRTTNATFLSSFGDGLERKSDEGSLIFDETNSPLVISNPTDQLVLVPAIESAADGVWVANYGAITPLHFLSATLNWESYSFSQPQAQFPIDLLVDRNGWVWMIIDPSKGGGIVVFNKSTNQSVYLNNLAGKGGLPSAAVRSIAIDREGWVWVGTDEGVVYFSNPGNVFSASIDASRPIFENRFLLRDEKVTAIAIDGGNRKWLGSNNGVWLFDQTGEKLIYNFTMENSPLLSDRIISITIDPISGEVFFGTDKGMASFRSTATQSTNRFADVKIFPNPVNADFNGQVAINGLYRDAIVKITDMGGRLIWQTQANGGTAIWNARQVNGNRVNTGMYLVFATAEDGSERHVGKIAVIE
ncbi:MAG TPA: hypothetical protein DIS90_05035 [Cytophagales bacterium]|nr:hypothetical protein [Cytophagales bacterium]